MKDSEAELHLILKRQKKPRMDANEREYSMSSGTMVLQPQRQRSPELNKAIPSPTDLHSEPPLKERWFQPACISPAPTIHPTRPLRPDFNSPKVLQGAVACSYRATPASAGFVAENVRKF